MPPPRQDERLFEVRILIVSQYYWPEDFRINDLAIGLVEKGHQVTVLTGKPNYPGGSFFKGYGFFNKTNETCNGIAIKRVPIIPRGRGGAFRLLMNYLSFVVSALLLGPFLCRGKYDVIFVYEPSPVTVGIPARFLGWLKKIPVIFWVQDLWPESLVATGTTSNKYIISAVGKMVKWIYSGCALILTQSRTFVESIKEFGISETRIQYYPNSAEKLYEPVTYDQATCKRLGLPEGFIVMFAGNIGVSQDFETILAAAAITREMTDLHWVIVGDGREFSRVEKEVKKMGLENTFHLMGRHPVESMPIFFSCADVMLVSLKNEPIFAMTIPSKIQSYMACGKPILAALAGEGAHIVEEAEAGIASGAEDPAALADGVMQLYNMQEEERNQMGQNGLDYYRHHFDRDMLYERLDSWMHNLVKADN